LQPSEPSPRYASAEDPMLLSAKDTDGQRTTSVRLMRTLGQLLAGIGALFKPHSLR
jgi:hypothetical protein